METMTKEESLNLLKLEMLTSDKFNKNFVRMYKAVEKAITKGKMTYMDFVNDTINYMESQEDAEDLEVRKEIIDNMCNELANKYEEICKK